jgi:PAS domain-containing protein
MWYVQIVHYVKETGFIRIYGYDVTERKQAEEDLHWKTALLEAQINSSLDGIAVDDNMGKKILQNQRAIDLWQIPQHILDNHDDEAQIQYTFDMALCPAVFQDKFVYLRDHPRETSLDEVELRNGTVLDMSRNMSMKMRHFHKTFSVSLHRSSTMVC